MCSMSHVTLGGGRGGGEHNANGVLYAYMYVPCHFTVFPVRDDRYCTYV